MFAWLPVFIITLSIYVSTIGGISTFQQSQDDERNVLFSKYLKHKSDPLKYPLPMPTTTFEVAYLKLLSKEAARESQKKIAEITRKG